MSHLFESAKIGTMALANRFVRSATWEGLATVDGAVTPELVKAIGELARGGVGLIISSHAYVRPDGQAGPGNSALTKTNSCRACGGWRRPPAKTARKWCCSWRMPAASPLRS